MFSERLRALRTGQHLTLESLATELNAMFPTDKQHENTPAQIGNWERGVRTPSYLEVQKLAKFFDVTMDYITGLSENTAYDLGRLFISDKDLTFNGQLISSADRYEVYQLIAGYLHGRDNRTTESTHQQGNQEQLNLNINDK
ncbi:helix-turn-helix domain-containing protein [Lentilactobacillus sp. SPB1-3]|uniref:Helix-turn-helix domain-containing protein n=1 Tax=Lentilactobacillus terminaliae TaxID=3003483 RepID=A0ACD5DE29_9LACO|nr:helix-turn-helix transcriptional regulator [Lentilactobacillus sp. SPB1-3]MCZ0977525.1 helix-turn-helix transcriptional regulator [Lentilactobacillus sp. SPB1-3]